MFNLIPLVSGLLFGLGMALSGMTDPKNVINFLDLTGNWDPSLAFVMGGAIAVFMPGYFLFVKPRSVALSGEPIALPSNPRIDKKLVSGSALFGLGWGISGICPGPAISSVSYGSGSILIFIAAMLVGSLIAKRIVSARIDK